jgi:hypothetical protein
MPDPTPPEPAAPVPSPPEPGPPAIPPGIADPDFGRTYLRPPFVKRLRWLNLLLLLPIVSWIWLWPGPPGWPAPLVVVLPQFLVIGIIAFIYQRAKRRVNRVVKASDGRACWYCVYDLSGLPSPGVCPECGRLYEHDDLRRRWRTADW